MGGLPGNALLPSAFLVCAGCSHFTINSHAPSDCPWRFLRSKTTATSSPLVISGDLRAGKRPKPGSPKRGGLGYSLPLTPRYLSVTKKKKPKKQKNPTLSAQASDGGKVDSEGGRYSSEPSSGTEARQGNRESLYESFCRERREKKREKERPPPFAPRPPTRALQGPKGVRLCDFIRPPHPPMSQEREGI